MRLDHLAVSAATRDEARAYVEEALGLKMQTGGVHERFGTHNHLMGLEDGLYLEAISIDPDAPRPDRPRWFGLDRFTGTPRLTNWICAVPDMALACEKWPQAGAAVALERAELRWQMAVPENGETPFDRLFPPLIQWQGDLHPASMLARSGAKLRRLTVSHPEAQALGELLGPIGGALIAFEASQTPALVAEFDTPHGPRILR